MPIIYDPDLYLRAKAARRRRVLIHQSPTHPREANWLQGLSAFAANRLADEGFTSKKEVVAGLRAGTISKIPNVGKRTLAKIQAWVGVD